MITQDQIITLAKKYQSTELNIRREYFQHLFLSYFYQQPQTKFIYFKGGTALRILYKSPRFSEDLDFSANLTKTLEIEQALVETLSEIEREGINTVIQEAKITTGGYLASIVFQAGEYTVVIQIEISLRQGDKRGEFVTVVNDFIPTYTILSLSSDQLVDEKVQALLSRKKPRDFYDLYFILRANLLPAVKKNVLPDVLITLKKVDINFESELKQFLPKSHWGVMKDFKQNLAREIQRFI